MIVNSDKQNIIFLDVDGPLIPTGMFYINPHASIKRICSPICVAIVNSMCKKFDAKLVMNTTHNSDYPKSQEDFIREGIKEENFYQPSSKTRYPKRLNGEGRMECILDWIDDNGGYEKFNWVALDDMKFTDDERLIVVDYETGITPEHYNKIAYIWGYPKDIILV